MRLLNDEMLCDYLNRPDPLVKGLKVPMDWFDKDSPVQPSSIDLHIGTVFLPGTKHRMDGSADKPLTAHTLGPGETAVIVTLETLNLPGNVAAIGFPPSRVSEQGILMTNPRHVDPGYVGPMHFTVINMGRQEYSLRSEDMIVTVLFFEMSAAARNDWTKRTGGTVRRSPEQEDINRLSRDFLDVTSRAENVVATSGLRLRAIERNEKIALALIPVLLAGAGYVGSWLTGAKELDARIRKLESAQAVTELSLSLDRRLTALENRFPVQPTAPAPGAVGSRQGRTSTAPQSKRNEMKK